MEIGEVGDGDVEAVVALWRHCELTRPWNDPYADIALARRSPNAAVLIGREDSQLVATAMLGHDGHRGWVYYLAVDPAARRAGCGRQMMQAVEAWLAARGVPKLQLMVRSANTEVLAFYAALGMEEQQVTVLGKWIDGR